MRDPAAFGLRLYRALARAFPHEFQNVYGEDLLQMGEDAIEPIWRREGFLGLARLLADIAIRVPIEHFSEWSLDVRYALRVLRASPGFTLVALLSLSLGITIATCAFSEMNGLALRTLPGVQNPHELAALQLPTPYPTYRRYREQSSLFSSTMAYIAPVPFGVAIAGHVERMWGHLVTDSYFATLGVQPALGSFSFGPQTGAVISYRLWQDHLGSDPAAISKTLRINSQTVTVLGVTPRNFQGASPMLFAADLWIPVSAGPRIAPELAGNILERPDRAVFRVVGRLQPGVSMSRAEAALDTIAKEIDPTRDQKGRRVLLVEGGKLLPLRKQDVPFFTSFLTIMAGLVMLIACTNVANMMLARAARRRKEIAVRLSLGASRARLLRQLLTESMIVACAAAVPGFLFSTWLMRLSSQVRMPLPIPVTFDFTPDLRVLLLTTALTIATGLAFGLAPALQATRADLVPALKEGGDAAPFRFRRLTLRNALMVAQVAGSLTLLVILGLLSAGIQTTMGVQTGFDPANLSLIALDPIRDGLPPEEAAGFLAKLLDRVKALPAVRSAVITETVPIAMPGGSVNATANGLTASAIKHVVGRDYFETAGIPVLLGRAFRREDERDQATSVIVSEAFVRAFWKDANPLGGRMEIGNGEIAPAKVLPGSYDYRPAVAGSGRKVLQIAGVVKDISEGLVVQKPRPAIYLPLHSSDYAQPAAQGLTLMVRSVPGADATVAIQREIQALDARVTPFNARSMSEQADQFMAPLRAASWTYGLVGIFGLVLASVGLAGMTAYSVARRVREIGIRMALGARPADELSLVMKDGMVLVAAGTLVGMLGAIAGARLLSAMNSSVGNVTSTSTSDPIILIGAPLLLGALALVACYLPARRSTRIDPTAALRQE
jgi:predicted permease